MSLTDRRRDPRSIIEALIREQTKYLRHYIGRVTDNQDAFSRGRVLVQVPDLGWNTDASGAWCWPRFLHGMRVPEIGEWVEVYFVAGDPDQPAYLGQAGEIQNQKPAAYDGPTTKVLYQDPKTGFYVKHDQDADLLDLNGDKTMVTHAALDTALQGLVADINTALATKKDEAGSAGSLTLDIGGAEAKKVRTE